MIRHIVPALLMLLAVGSEAAAQDWARKMFKTTHHDFGTVARGAKAEFSFEFTNLYEEDVHVAGVRSSCECTTPRVTKTLLKTIDTSAIVAVFSTRSFLGHKEASITVTIDQPFFAEVQLTVEGLIRSDIVFSPGAVKLGEIEQGEVAETKIKVSYAGRPDWDIVDVRSANTNFEVELSDALRTGGQVSYVMTVRLKPSAPAGYIQDQLTIVTNDQTNRSIPLAVEGRVVSPLTVSPASLFLGVLKPGESVTKKIVVRAKKPFRITGVQCEDECFQVDSSEEPKKLHFVPVTFVAGEKTGKIEETIRIETDLNSGATARCIATASVQNDPADP